MTTLPGDLSFVPKVWSDHIMAYFDKLLVFGAVATLDTTLKNKPGETFTFPYYKAIGAAEKPGVDEALTVDKLQDDSFSCTVDEIGKAVGIRKGALIKSGDPNGMFSEAQRQIARVIAEQYDADLITEVNTSGNYVQAYTDADAADANRMTIRNILKAKVTGFGDKHEQAIAIYMHSQHYLDLLSDTTAGFLKADANDPFWQRPGFQGRLLGMALFVTDQCPAATAINGKTAYQAFIVKPNPYGVCMKEELDMEMDYDILHREYVFAGTQWYGVKGFHAKVATNDYRVARMTVATQVSA